MGATGQRSEKTWRPWRKKPGTKRGRLATGLKVIESKARKCSKKQENENVMRTDCFLTKGARKLSEPKNKSLAPY